MTILELLERYGDGSSPSISDKREIGRLSAKLWRERYGEEYFSIVSQSETKSNGETFTINVIKYPKFFYKSIFKIIHDFYTFKELRILNYRRKNKGKTPLNLKRKRKRSSKPYRPNIDR